MITRRNFLGGAALGGVTSVLASSAPRSLDRTTLVTRHNPILRALDPSSPLSVGNGEFAFTADITGLQTFPQAYENAMPLCTMTQWGWHTTPLPEGISSTSLRRTFFEAHGRQVGYAISGDGQKELYNWQRENPHRLHLGQIGLRLLLANGREVAVKDLAEIEQQLNLWTGILTSRFKIEGEPVTVLTTAHPAFDVLAVKIDSPLITAGRLAIRFAFPYGSPEMQAADWAQPRRHQSRLIAQNKWQATIERTLDADRYFTVIGWSDKATLATEKEHVFLLTPDKQSSSIDFTVGFAKQAWSQTLPDATATIAASEKHWQQFWQTGGAIELAGSRDQRAPELERRIVLSQYLTAIQCAGSLPPQETGLTVNSWYGKYHLEMHWWHAAHFTLWNRAPLLEKSLGWYHEILPKARELAQSQGYSGARWPKMTSPAGLDSPSPIGPLLIWQQPHPIFYAELSYRAHPNRQTLERYREVVFASATFMASYAFYDAPRGRYVLGPPVIPAQENHPPRETWNPTFELSYWAFGLELAQRWRERLGLTRLPRWENVRTRLSSLPTAEGVYLAHENCPQTFTERNRDHPSMLGALGMLPGDGVNRATMRRTLDRTLQQWRWDETWGWDYPLTAMTAARLGRPALAIEALLMKTAKNHYLPNGHNWQRSNLPCYLPGNGGLLYAVALMAAGWQEAPRRHAPGFPLDGSWHVRWEKLAPAM